MALNCIADGKFGIAGSINWAQDTACINWYWSWGAGSNPNATGVEFVPNKFSLWWPSMQAVTNHTSPYILGWNEPNHAEQTKIDPSSPYTHQQWKNLWYASKNASKLVGGPQVAGCGANCIPANGSGVQQWLVPFWSGVCPACVQPDTGKLALNKSCCEFMPDFGITHIYFNSVSSAMRTLQEHIDFYGDIPIWITEFGVTLKPSKNAEKVLFDFIDQIQKKKEVFRASWYIYTLWGGLGVPMYDANKTLTAAGQRYIDTVNVATNVTSTTSFTTTSATFTELATTVVESTTTTLATTESTSTVVSVPTTTAIFTTEVTQTTTEVSEQTTTAITPEVPTTDEPLATTTIDATSVVTTDSIETIVVLEHTTVSLATETAVIDFPQTPVFSIETTTTDASQPTTSTFTTDGPVTTETSTSANCNADGKFGIAGNINWLEDTGCINWYWSWGAKANPNATGVEFVPNKFSIWWPSLKEVTNFTSPYILGWNEPNHAEQTNIDPSSKSNHEQWKSLWYAAKNASKLLGSPQVANCGANCMPSSGSGVQQWLVPFWSGVCPACVHPDTGKLALSKSCCEFMPDFAVTHLYFNSVSSAMKLLQEQIDFYGDIPIWITEFGVTLKPSKNAEKVLFDFIDQVQKKKEVFRASWYIYTLWGGLGVPMYDANKTLTAAGKRYIDTVNVATNVTSTTSFTTTAATFTELAATVVESTTTTVGTTEITSSDVSVPTTTAIFTTEVTQTTTEISEQTTTAITPEVPTTDASQETTAGSATETTTTDASQVTLSF